MPLPVAPKAPQTIRREMSGSGAAYPASTVISSTAPNLFPRSWQVGGVAQITKTVAVPGLSAGAATVVATLITFAPNNLTSPNAFPLNPITLGVGQSAFILLSIFLTPPASGTPPSSPFFGVPYARLIFYSGAPIAPTNGGTFFTLTGPGSFSNPTAFVWLPVFAPATFSATTVLLTVEGVLFGVPS